MSLRDDGSYRCDSCGTDVGNGGVRQADIVSSLDPQDENEPVVLHLCRAPRDGYPHGCARHFIGAAATADYTQSRSR